MKFRILLILGLVTFPLSSLFAQIEVEPQQEASKEEPYRIHKHSFGIGVLGGGELRSSMWAMPGLGYKYYTKEGAFRALLGGVLNNNYGFDGNYTESGMSLRVGYQHHVMLGRFMPIIGADIAGGFYDYFDSWGGGKNEMERFSAGVSTNLGLEFWLVPKLSILIDTRFDISFQEQYSLNEWIDAGNNPVRNESKATSVRTNISPISSFMAIFHF